MKMRDNIKIDIALGGAQPIDNAAVVRVHPSAPWR